MTYSSHFPPSKVLLLPCGEHEASDSTLSGDTESTFRHLECLSLRNIGAVCEQVRFLRIKKYPMVIRTGKTHFVSKNKSQRNVNIVCLSIGFYCVQVFHMH